MLIPFEIDVDVHLPIEIWRFLIRAIANNECEYCGSKKDLQAHHIDKNYENNAITNGICLCVGCHSELHQAMKTHSDMLIRVVSQNRLIQLKALSHERRSRRG